MCRYGIFFIDLQKLSPVNHTWYIAFLYIDGGYLAKLAEVT